MAKSIRSKHRRKMRNVKRQFYAKKDLEKLKKVVSHSSVLDELVTTRTVKDLKVEQDSQELPNLLIDNMIAYAWRHNA
ncbi:protein LLP, partial [Biomphalaria pfeifferi]